MQETVNHGRLQKQKLKVIKEGNTVKFVDDNDNVVKSKTIVRESDKVTITNHEGKVKVYEIPDAEIIRMKRSMKNDRDKVAPEYNNEKLHIDKRFQIASISQTAIVNSIENINHPLHGCEVGSLIRGILSQRSAGIKNIERARFDVYEVTSESGIKFLSLQMAVMQLEDYENYNQNTLGDIINKHLDMFDNIKPSDVPNVYFDTTYRGYGSEACTGNPLTLSIKRDVELRFGSNNNVYFATYDKNIRKLILNVLRKAKESTGISKIIIPASLKRYQESFRKI